MSVTICCYKFLKLFEKLGVTEFVNHYVRILVQEKRTKEKILPRKMPRKSNLNLTRRNSLTLTIMSVFTNVGDQRASERTNIWQEGC